MKRNRNSKIVATLGPASENPKTIESLLIAGADIFRLNFSHANHDEHLKRFQEIKKLENKYKYPIGVIADLQGPKIRIGKFQEGKITLKENQKFSFLLEEKIGTQLHVYLPHPEIFKSIKIGSHILLNDGKIKLKTISVEKNKIETVVVIGGELSNHKGVNLPDIHLDTSSLTKKDQQDLNFAINIGIETIALSFVQSPNDILNARKFINNKNIQIISKIEKPLALKQIDEITNVSDGILVARGDLGVEIQPEKVPMAQKKIINSAKKLCKPIIVATQMLESMILSPTPTRAEVTDVSNAIYEGSDAVMLSGESAAGKYPLEAVQIMSKIIEETEKNNLYKKNISNLDNITKLTPENTLAYSACQSSKKITNSTIITLSTSGKTAKLISSFKTTSLILALTPNISIARKLVFFWGINSSIVDNIKDQFDTSRKSSEIILLKKLGKKGDIALILSNIISNKKNLVNNLHVIEIGNTNTYI